MRERERERESILLTLKVWDCFHFNPYLILFVYWQCHPFPLEPESAEYDFFAYNKIPAFHNLLKLACLELVKYKGHLMVRLPTKINDNVIMITKSNTKG